MSSAARSSVDPAPGEQPLRISLGDGGWLVWRDFCLRSAGFPLSRLEAVADRECALLADLSVEEPLTAPRFRARWDAVLARTAGEMLRIVEDGGVRQALVWQNPDFLTSVVDRLRNAGGDDAAYARDKHRKRREIKLMKYLQRYHAKNETIGFFGPSMWGAFSAAEQGIRFRPGPGLVRARSVVFEDWAVTSLARTFADDFGLRRHLPPVLALGTRLHGRAVLRAGSPTTVLDPDLALVAACCDGSRTPQAIAAEVRWRGDARNRTAEEIVRDLDRLTEMGILDWGFDIPVSPAAAAALRDQVTRLPDGPAKHRALAVLEDLDRARAEIPPSTGEADLLHKKLRDIDERFGSVTGAPAYRQAGSAGKARRVVVEDCERDADVAVGTDLLEDIGPALTLLLDSARWLVARLGRSYAEILEGILAEFGGTGEVPLPEVISRLMPALERAAAEGEAVAAFQERWRDVLAYEETDARLERDAALLREPVSRMFPASGPPPWHSAGYHSPDIMVAQHEGTGERMAVMGEMHLSQMSLAALSFTQFHPDSARLVAAADQHAHPYPWHVPLYPRGLPNLSTLHYPTPELQSERNSYLSFGRRRGARPAPRHRIRLIDDLVVRPLPTGPVVLRPDGQGPGTPLLEVVGEFLAQRVVNCFRPMPESPHTPRVTVDRLVVARETWRPDLASMPAGKGHDEPAAFAGIRRWARRLGLPRHVFWRVPWEPKPLYLDFESPMLVGLFATAMRRPGGAGLRATITEMLPTPEQLWLRDAEGRRYTSEFRLVTVSGSAQDGNP
ncbi:lantibiotic dehydratase [Nonomuraea sp. NPDC050451]|uniref:lantibiotic dehydratase n=1 Tax=Nonomuraea sp. NPDC050451 TaxID=3364364 RepID=UPI0037B256FA